jgi:hypothetical protein
MKKPSTHFITAPAYRFRAIHRFFFVVFAAACLELCGCNHGKKDPDKYRESLIGTWENKARFRENPVVTFHADGNYELTFENRKLVYNGLFRTQGHTISIMDAYCGKAAPASYLFTVKKDILAFTLIEDTQCDRNRFFPQEWQRVTK